jgi:hypothetical protein
MGTKSWLQSKIIWVQIASIVVDVINYLLTNPIFPTKYAGILSIVVGIITIILRTQSTTTISK